MLTAKPYISVHRYQICVERYGGSIIIFYFQEVQGGYEVNLHLLSPGPVYWAWLVRSRRKIDIQDHSSDITFATSTLCTLPISSFNPLGNYARVATGGDSVFGFCMVAGSHLPPQTISNQPAYTLISVVSCLACIAMDPLALLSDDEGEVPHQASSIQESHFP